MFSQLSFDFLNSLAANNDREWFKANQQQYEDQVRTPALQFIEAMQGPVLALSPRFIAVAKKVGGSLMRPQRDSRFSKNKTPYKTNVGIQFKHFQAKDVHAPGFYVHIANDECFIAAGIWHPESKALNAIRQCIDENPNAYQKALGQLKQAGFELTGDCLSRPPRGFDKNHPMIDELKRKDFIAIKPISPQQICQADFVEFCAQEYLHTSALMAYLCFALDLDF
ncbi:DUF2461 domain-containing protein [Shewanella livingstonensis]|uniref:DUF2461 domain-containing protein n=1 Tax=Shewanella livingstonensis TaxID=150120 RepID=A0A3G8LT97_9GAMM|nr:DUF2461 domain-containing protein [Shewanella livingstonensis]AZG72687.1 DUF2461 domain-containing protein [Shewanella livingstonensis]